MKPPKERDFCDLYGELMVSKLKALDEQRREIAMNRIDNILFEIKMSAINNREVPATSSLSHTPEISIPGSSKSSPVIASSAPLLNSNVSEQVPVEAILRE